jgi:soluble lytic murein transglycosylase
VANKRSLIRGSVSRPDSEMRPFVPSWDRLVSGIAIGRSFRLLSGVFMVRATQNKRTLWIFITVLTVGSVFLGLWMRKRTEARYDQHIVAAASRYRLDPALIKAVIWQESRFNARARGKAGEIGLMQIREDAAWEWADAEKIRAFQHEQILDPEKNIQCGSFYLSKLLKRYTKTDDPLPYALADYNAGRSNVLRWNKGAAQTNSAAFLAQMDYPRTREYALKIIDKRGGYLRQFEATQLASR